MLDLRWKSAVARAAVLAATAGLALPWSLPAADPTPSPKKAGHEHKDKGDKATPAASATPVAADTPAVPEAPPLTREQMADSVSLDELTVPTPGELFAALNKQCKPNWMVMSRGPINTAYSDRAQAALNLGGLIADGYVAVEAQDAQQVKNIGRDILALAKTLSINKEILARGSSIQQLADDNNWSSLREELESTQDEVKQAMDSLHDEELVTLVSIGGWVRGTQVVSDVVLRNYSQATSCILRQPALVEFLRSKLAALPARAHDDALVKSVDAGLAEMSKTVSFPLGATPSKEDVQTLHDEASKLVNQISTKKEG